MPFEVDHVFITVPSGAPQMDELVSAGFEEGPPNTHPGQGTACRRVFFQHCYLEFIWLESPSGATAPNLGRTALIPRVRMLEGVSRLGVGLRPVRASESALPLRTWPFRPPYLPEGASIPIAANSRVLHEPLIFFMPPSPGWRRSERIHANGVREVTGVQVALAGDRNPSPELEWLGTLTCLTLEWADDELLIIELDRAEQGRRLDLRPSIPLVLDW